MLIMILVGNQRKRNTHKSLQRESDMYGRQRFLPRFYQRTTRTARKNSVRKTLLNGRLETRIKTGFRPLDLVVKKTSVFWTLFLHSSVIPRAGMVAALFPDYDSKSIL